MSISRFAAGLAYASLVAVSGVGMTVADTFVKTAPAHAQSAGQSVTTLRGCFRNVPFTGTIAFNPTRIRQSPSTSAAVVGTFTSVGQVVSFSGVTTGTAVNDAWDNQPDNMWYRLADGRGFVASAVIKGYPPRATCLTPASKAERFFASALGQKGIVHPTNRSFDGQCATLSAVYLQNVFIGGNFRAYGNGRDVARSATNAHPNLFQFKTSGIPKRGAIISFLGAGYDGTFGHVGIVMETNGTQIKILESNHDGLGKNSVVRISGWKSRAGVIGWADPINPLP